MPQNVRLPKKEDIPESELETKQPRRLIQSITFFGDSAIPEGDIIYQSVWEASKKLANAGFTIVNGGGPGIMKAATDGAESVNGDTVAVYWEPKLASFFEGKNLANVTDESDASANYVNRTFGLIQRGDAYVVCKGGTGTVSEFGLVWCLAKLYYGCHKPVILFGDFWDELIEAFRKSMYIDETELGVLYQATTGDEIIEIINKHEVKLKNCVQRDFTKDDSGEAAFVLGGRRAATAKHYNEEADSYHSEHAGNLVSQEQLDEFKTLVNAPAQVLDIGTGPGFDLKYLSEKYSVTGIDISKRMVEIARFENPDKEILHADIVDHELGQNKYKGIWSRGALHHIENQELDKVFKKISDALVEGGIFYMIVREGEGESVEVDKKDYGDVERFYHFFNEKELSERAQKAGLTVLKVDHQQRSHKWIIGVFRK
jgi:hypothetical protein